MTLVLGIRCGDGIVVGADSMITSGSLRGNVRVDGKKIFLLPDDRGIVACAGDVVVSQIVMDDLREQWPSIAGAEIGSEVKDLVSKSIRRALADENSQFERLDFSALVALTIQHQATLLLYRGTQPAFEARDGVYFLRAGSGDLFASLFQKLLERIFWNGEAPPLIGDGVFSALWTLTHIIEANAAMGIGGPPRIAVLEDRSNQGDWRSRMLPNHELDEFQQLIQSLESSMRQVKASWSQG